MHQRHGKKKIKFFFEFEFNLNCHCWSAIDLPLSQWRVICRLLFILLYKEDNFKISTSMACKQKDLTNSVTFEGNLFNTTASNILSRNHLKSRLFSAKHLEPQKLCIKYKTKILSLDTGTLLITEKLKIVIISFLTWSQAWTCEW